MTATRRILHAIRRAGRRRLATVREQRARQQWATKGATIDRTAVVPPGAELTAKTVIDAYSEFTGPPSLAGPGSITVGRWCAIGVALRVTTTDHDTSGANMHMPLQCRLGLPTHFESRGPVVIGDACWIGDRVTVLGNVTIGVGSVLGAGSVVTRDVPPFAVAAGVPARPLRDRFTPDMVALLLEDPWWDWPIDRIERNRAFFGLDLTVTPVEEARAAIVP